jgi:hypothetical protein
MSSIRWWRRRQCSYGEVASWGTLDARPPPACPAGEAVRRLEPRCSMQWSAPAGLPGRGRSSAAGAGVAGKLLHLPGKPARVEKRASIHSSWRTRSPAGQAGRGSRIAQSKSAAGRRSAAPHGSCEYRSLRKACTALNGRRRPNGASDCSHGCSGGTAQLADAEPVEPDCSFFRIAPGNG